MEQLNPYRNNGNSLHFNGTHGLSRHPLYSLYRDVINRCYRKKTLNYERYGGVGVTMCDEWRNDFKIFYDWCIANGWQPGLQLDKDIKAKEKGVPAKMYSPDFCQFVTQKVNARNTSSNRYIKHNGETKTMAEWAEVLKFSYKLLHQRLVRDKLTFEEAISKPLRIWPSQINLK